MLINNATYQRETVSERPIRQPLKKEVTIVFTCINNVAKLKLGAVYKKQCPN